MTTTPPESRKHDITTSLSEIRQKVSAATAARGSGSGSGSGKGVTLVAVSKTKPASDLMCAYEAGQRHFGENIQELVDKAAELPTDINWHFIGSLQSNKCKTLCTIRNLYAVETIDSAKKADLINKAWDDEDGKKPLRVFVQINTSGEESKSGVQPDDALPLAKHIAEKCPKLRLQGLMTIGSPERDSDPGAENPDFTLLAKVKTTLDTAHNTDLDLSMGMSDDFEQAIRQGSTNVRVGSSIFGARSYPAKA
ncbi:alanine racemase [Fimicolochytrium jonesii]|uniref:alanine racemase n=1 Tax=Fimicolochytrium jonesii TaxID=1396493 RepID=UPI0022FE7FD6|nr:alanine racemase [Fimicolochytrium jonesii]KAI8820994.1 alanine racemase [Fimicolochytrium jonesii]